ncbi:MAG TPA: hypothetical protein VGV87_25560 [Blastocatellia bacterium]|jgi:hypothetical protein|nr:hypothetical protein [Blastocatellia bacterium]
METRTRLLHKLTGIVTVLIFLGTGAYMRFNSPALFESDPTVRMMFRSTHIYILLSGLLNLGIGSYLLLSRQRWRRILQLIGSSFVLVAPVLLICAFFYEPSSRSVERPLTLPAMLLLMIGTLSHLLSNTGSSMVEGDRAVVSDHALQPIHARRAGASEYGKGD